jgi:hypothetical protein
MVGEDLLDSPRTIRYPGSHAPGGHDQRTVRGLPLDSPYHEVGTGVK